MSATGKCLCGSVTYSLASTPLKLKVCHCKNCQRQAGAAFAVCCSTIADLDISGSPKVFLDGDTVSGNTVARHFCGDWLSPRRSGSGTQDRLCHQRHAGPH